MTQLVLIKMEKSLKTLGVQYTGIISEICDISCYKP